MRQVLNPLGWFCCDHTGHKLALSMEVLGGWGKGLGVHLAGEPRGTPNKHNAGPPADRGVFTTDGMPGPLCTFVDGPTLGPAGTDHMPAPCLAALIVVVVGDGAV